MKFIGILYKNHEIDDQGTFNSLPEELKIFYRQVNGIIAFKGGLHIRGCCVNPNWHSLSAVWTGKLAFWKNYPDILDTDIPFGQDCMGDQFLFRGNKVIKLFTETGEVENLEISFTQFLEEVEKDPVTFLGMHPLVQFEMEGGQLEAGKLLDAYPPFCMKQAASSVSIKAVPVEERLQYLADLSKQVRRMQDGDDVKFIIE